MFQITEIDPSEKEAALKEDYAVIIEVPENFTYDLLRNVMLDEGDIGTITLYEKHEIGSAAVKSVVQTFEEQLSMKDRKSTRLNSSHVAISYAVFCLKKKNKIKHKK